MGRLSTEKGERSIRFEEKPEYQHSKDTHFAISIYTFTAVPIKTLARCVHEDKLTLKCMQEGKGTRMPQAVLKKKKERRNPLPALGSPQGITEPAEGRRYLCSHGAPGRVVLEGRTARPVKNMQDPRRLALPCRVSTCPALGSELFLGDFAPPWAPISLSTRLSPQRQCPANRIASFPPGLSACKPQPRGEGEFRVAQPAPAAPASANDAPLSRLLGLPDSFFPSSYTSAR